MTSVRSPASQWTSSAEHELSACSSASVKERLRASGFTRDHWPVTISSLQFPLLPICPTAVKRRLGRTGLGQLAVRTEPLSAFTPNAGCQAGTQSYDVEEKLGDLLLAAGSDQPWGCPRTH